MAVFHAAENVAVGGTGQSVSQLHSIPSTSDLSGTVVADSDGVGDQAFGWLGVAVLRNPRCDRTDRGVRARTRRRSASTAARA